MQTGQPMMQQQQMQPGMQMQQPMQMQPGMVVQPGMQMVQVVTVADNRTAYQKLMQMNGVFIKQKIDLMEAMTGCEMANKYDASDLTKDQEGKGYQNGTNLFRAVEQSGCLERQFLTGPMRPMEISICHFSPNSMKVGQPVFQCKKPCKCPMLCLCRPEMEVFFTEMGANQKLGTIRQPFQCCDIVLEIYDAADRKVMEVRGPVCQCGIFCPGCPCEQCQTVMFDILDAQGQVHGSFRKQTKGCVASALTDADNFAVDFPKHFGDTYRALLLCSAFMMDFMFFEDNSQKNQNRHH